MIETGVIKMQAKKVLSVLFMEYGITWLVVALVGIAVFLILGFLSDYRFFILALIWVFLFLPLVMAFLYFFYGMLPLTAFNSVPHVLIFSDSSITVRLHDTNQEENDDEPEETSHKEYEVNKDLFLHYKTGPDYVLLFFKKNGWLWLPVAGLESFKQFNDILFSFSNGKQ